MKFTRDPAYSTSTGPDPVAAADVDVAAPVAGELAGVLAEELELDELLDELHPATVTAAQSRPATASLREALCLPKTLWKIVTGRPYQAVVTKALDGCRTVIAGEKRHVPLREGSAAGPMASAHN